jgi:hypothetical protein
MNELIPYSICLALTLVLLIFGKLLVGRDFYLPFVIFPMLLAMLVMGEKVNIFSPNGGRIKPFTHVLGIFFAILLVPLLAGVLYGLYSLVSGGVHSLTAAEGVERTGPASPTTAALLRINGVLWHFPGGHCQPAGQATVFPGNQLERSAKQTDLTSGPVTDR